MIIRKLVFILTNRSSLGLENRVNINLTNLKAIIRKLTRLDEPSSSLRFRFID